MKSSVARSLLVVGLFGLMMLPISYAVIDDARTSQQTRLIQDALHRASTLPLEGIGRVEFRGREGSYSVRATFRRGSERSSKVLEVLKDGKPLEGGQRHGWLTASRWVPRFTNDLPLVLRNYRLNVSPPESVAGRACIRIDFEGRYGATRPRHSLWIDPVDRMLVRRTVESEERTMTAEFETVTVMNEAPEPPKPDRGPRRGFPSGPPFPGHPGGHFQPIEPGGPKPALDFEPVDLSALPHGFERRSFGAIRVSLREPLKFESRAALSVYTDGLQNFSVMQMKTADYEKLVNLIRALRETRIDAVLRRMSRGNLSAEMLRHGWLASASRGGTTLVASGSIDKEETATLLSRFLD